MNQEVKRKVVSTERGLPGLRGTDHVGITVPDIEQATDFFVNVLGCEQFYDLGPFQATDDWMTKHLNVHPRTVMKNCVFSGVRMEAITKFLNMRPPSKKLHHRLTAMLEAITWHCMWIILKRPLISLNLTKSKFLASPLYEAKVPVPGNPGFIFWPPGDCSLN